MLKIYTDAATKDQKISGGGIVIIGEDIYQQLALPLTEKSNHLAEMAVILTALEYVIKKNWHKQTVLLYSDSKTAVQLFDQGRTKNQHFQPFLERFEALAAEFELLILQWVPEKQNKGADHLARQGLRKAEKIN